MALIHSASTSNSSSHANPTGVFSSRANTSHHSLLYTSAKITGVFLFIVLSVLIVLSAQANSKEASAAFEAADQSAGLKLEVTNDTQAGATQYGNSTRTETSSSFETSTGKSSNSNDGAVQLDVNGESVTVAPNSSYQKVMDDTNGTTTVQVNTSTRGDASNRTRTTTKLNVSSSSTTSTDLSTKVKVSGDGTGGSN